MSANHKDTHDQRSAGGGQLKAIARRRWRLAVVTFSLPCACVAGLVAFLPSLYESRALVLVDPPSPGSPEVSGARIEQLTKENLSQPRLVALLDKLHEPGDAAALRRDVDIEPEKVSGPSGQTSIGVAVRVRGFDPHRAARVANELAGFYLEAERARLESDAGRFEAQLARIEVQIRDARARLDDEESRLREFEAQHLRELPEQVQVHLASLESLNAQLALIRLNRAKALERAQAQSDTTAPRPPADPTEVELARLRQALAELRTRNTDQHPDVVRMRRQIENLEALRKPAPVTPPVNHARALDAELQSWTREERVLEGRIEAVQHEALNAARRGQERATLLPSYEAARATYTELLRRYEELQSKRGDGDRVPFHIVEEARPTEQAALPNRTRLASLGLIFSVLAAGAAVWLREQVDRSFHSSGELRAFTRVPVLTHVPRIATAADLRRRRWRTLVGGLALAIVVVALVAGIRVIADNGIVFHLFTRSGSS